MGITNTQLAVGAIVGGVLLNDAANSRNEKVLAAIQEQNKILLMSEDERKEYVRDKEETMRRQMQSLLRSQQLRLEALVPAGTALLKREASFFGPLLKLVKFVFGLGLIILFCGIGFCFGGFGCFVGLGLSSWILTKWAEHNEELRHAGRLYYTPLKMADTPVTVQSGRADRASVMIKMWQSYGWSRDTILLKLQSEFGLGAVYASVLYQKFGSSK